METWNFHTLRDKKKRRKRKNLVELQPGLDKNKEMNVQKKENNKYLQPIPKVGLK